ncbi:unnamed protein product [Acanthoscelides obtectus]|uniref:Mos1 transposase HTH domain-containing protein n=1 Tax=Acanthoscelides obtectus TaxID=200917 RepID=A0A9P0JV43_ACAOB|nr:unnamed protein product [Acanthoscelides obtectus]CAK1621299.1 Histone-lysine N-methyltransferase SETMAR [Acanthoscelides obtectus]
MVWGSMSSKGVGKLHFIDGNVDLAILEESLLPVMEECLTSGQDFVSARWCHTSKKAIKWIEENNVPLLKWVSSTPDLSPIETLWHEMKKVLRQHPAQHFRAIIYYNFQRQLSQQECLAELLSVFGNEAPHQSTICRWYGEFKRGRVSLSDDPRVCAPKTAVTQENVDAVRKLIFEDIHVTYREIEASLKISKTSIQKNLHAELGVRKLVSQQKAARVNWCQKTLDRFNSGNSKNVYSIAGGDESCIYCYEPESKRSEEKPTKVIRSRSVSKKMVSKASHIATIPLNEQRTVTAEWYTTICLPNVITDLRKINPERRIILHQDNASSHTAQKTRQYLTEENVELLDPPPYNPDLGPNDFFTFPKIKNRLRGQRFQSPEEAVDAFKNAVLDLPANEWNKCFEDWFERIQMCINLRGEYFEKE